jgi:hypothetical protein
MNDRKTHGKVIGAAAIYRAESIMPKTARTQKHRTAAKRPAPSIVQVKGIPYGGIRLTDAFNDLFRLLTPNWQDWAQKSSIWFELEHLGDETPDEVHPDELWEAAQAGAEATLRKALSERQLSACIKPPGEPAIVLEPEEWWTFGKYNGIHSNYVSPADPKTPGPDSSRAGRHLPVFLVRNEFTDWLETFRTAKRVKAAKKVKTAKKVKERGGKNSVEGLSQQEHEIKVALKNSRVMRHVVAFFLERYKSFVNAPMSLELDREIEIFLRGLPERTSNSTRVTNRTAYHWATAIIGMSRKRTDWIRLGVPISRTKKRSTK